MEDNRKSFMFYLEWQNQLELLSDEELRRFIYNLIRYHNGEEIELKSTIDKLVWNGVLPAIRINDKKYQNMIERNQKNGTLGGRPKTGKDKQKKPIIQDNPDNPDGFNNNPDNPDGFSENPKNPIIDNGEMITGNSKKKKDKREKLIENGKLENENGKKINGNSGPVKENEDEKIKKLEIEEVNYSEVDFHTLGLVELENIIKNVFQDFPDWPHRLSLFGVKNFFESFPKSFKYESWVPELVETYNFRVTRRLKFDDEKI